YGPTKDKTLVPMLKVAVAGTDQYAKVQAARILFEIEKKAADVLPIYTAVIKDTNRTNWSYAVQGLGDLGPAAKTAVPRLIGRMKTPQYHHYDVRTTLVKVGEESIKPLVKVLEETATVANTYMSPQESAVYCLGQLGAPAAKAVAASLKSKEYTVRLRAVRGLSGIGPDAKDQVQALIDTLGDTTFSVKEAAVGALGSIGPDASKAVTKLI